MQQQAGTSRIVLGSHPKRFTCRPHGSTWPTARAGGLIMITALSLPFLAKKPIDLPPIVSVELIQITDKTNIPFAPKAKKIIEKIKEKEKKLVSEQAPPKKVKKIKPDSVPMPDDKVKKVEKIKEDKQNPEKIDNEVKQVSEFEKKELFDPKPLRAPRGRPALSGGPPLRGSLQSLWGQPALSPCGRASDRGPAYPDLGPAGRPCQSRAPPAAGSRVLVALRGVGPAAGRFG